MSFEFVTEDRYYHVVEHGNGWAYEVTESRSGKSIFVQDEAASQLQADTEDFTDNAILAEYFDGLDDD